MSAPSVRLRVLKLAMRWVVKPQFQRTGSPETAARNFEWIAPFLFSKPKGMKARADGPLLRVTFGSPTPNRAILFIHGGAFMAGSPRSYRAMGGRLAKRTGATVFLADYPLLQDAPFPAAPLAVLAAWDYLIDAGWTPDQIVIAGDSAGGNLVFGLLSTLLLRGQRPAGVVGFSPWGDLTVSGDTITTNAARDPFIPVARMQEAIARYLAGANPT